MSACFGRFNLPSSLKWTSLAFFYEWMRCGTNTITKSKNMYIYIQKSFVTSLGWESPEQEALVPRFHGLSVSARETKRTSWYLCCLRDRSSDHKVFLRVLWLFAIHRTGVWWNDLCIVYTVQWAYNTRWCTLFTDRTQEQANYSWRTTISGVPAGPYPRWCTL